MCLTKRSTDCYPVITGTKCPKNPKPFYSYLIEKIQKIGAPGAIRTPDPQIRSLVLYPAELRVRCQRQAMSPQQRCGKELAGEMQACFDA